MATLQYRRCAWLLNIINVHAPITRERINELWSRDEDVNPYRTHEIPLRTFQKTLRAIEDYFPVLIHCNRSTHEYSIEGGEIAGLSRTRTVSTIDLATREMHRWTEIDAPIQLFRIDALPGMAERLREHPLCSEQKEVSTNSTSGIVIFEYLMKPTWEWYEAIRSLGAAVKVLYPQWLADLVAEDAQGIADMYHEDHDNELANPGFVNPYDCHIIDTRKDTLYLTIPDDFYAVLMEGKLDEYNVILNPKNEVYLVQGNEAIPYTTLHVKAGRNADAPEAVVEVTKAELFDLTDVKDEDKTADHPMQQVVTYTLGKLIQSWQKDG